MKRMKRLRKPVALILALAMVAASAVAFAGCGAAEPKTLEDYLALPEEQRVELIEQALKKYGITCVRTVCEDSRTLHTKMPLYYFDKVLLDAPCSGLGTLKHKPEIKLNIKPEDIDELTRLQSQLLDSAALMVKENGILVYSTCTLNTKENDRQIRMFLRQHSEFELVSEKTVRPDSQHYDGFYISKLRKKC